MSNIKLIKKIGQGAFGTVYLGDRRGRKCAVKVVKFGGVPQKIVDDAIKEGKLLEHLQHPNIVTCLGCYGAGNTAISEIHIVMEYCGGGDLHANIKQQRASGQHFPERQVIGWFLDVVRAVEASPYSYRTEGILQHPYDT
ncbi:serine/threonine-protein kinase Nek5-like [Macrobrachium nipponense]|uniref:serine/threonine-protein kinase Nek5-like n=1 Tax=Macrobrachium nipponense TaxID=159736 RepID=UPI0030C7A4F6